MKNILKSYWKYSYIFCMLSWFTSVENGFFCLQLVLFAVCGRFLWTGNLSIKRKSNDRKTKQKTKLRMSDVFPDKKRNEIEQKKFSHQPNVVRCVNVINRRNKSHWWSRIATIITIRLGDSNNFPRNLQNMWMKKRKKKQREMKENFHEMLHYSNEHWLAKYRN